MSYYSPGASFPPDRIWGAIFAAVYGILMLVFGAFILFVAGGIALAGHQSGHGSMPFAIPMFGAAVAGILWVVLLVTMGAHIVAAIGIHKSQAWGFWATIILSVISLASSGGGNCLTIVPLVYSIMRLAGSYGPKPG